MADAVAEDDLLALAELAKAVREHAYAPYSRYHVGAALRTPSGRVFVGANVENATYGATLCAERAAVAGMVAAGERRIAAIAVATADDPPGLPCGICRQTLAEFGSPELVVLAVSATGERRRTLAELLPEPFGLRP